MSGWEIERGVTCVVCSNCAFTFDWQHVDDTSEGGYTCPECGCRGELADQNLAAYVSHVIEYTAKGRARRDRIARKARTPIDPPHCPLCGLNTVEVSRGATRCSYCGWIPAGGVA